MRVSEKMYRSLLRAYPLDYHKQYSALMEQLFRDRLRETRTFADLAALWVHTLADWAVSVPARHWEQVMAHTRFDSFGNPARRCIFFASYEAGSSPLHEVAVEHLLLGILRQEPSLVPAPAIEAVRRAIEAKDPRTAVFKERLRISAIPLSPETDRAVSAAKEIAQASGRGKVTPRDLAAGILRDANTFAACLLREHWT